PGVRAMRRKYALPVVAFDAKDSTWAAVSSSSAGASTHGSQSRNSRVKAVGRDRPVDVSGERSPVRPRERGTRSTAGRDAAVGAEAPARSVGSGRSAEAGETDAVDGAVASSSAERPATSRIR